MSVDLSALGWDDSFAAAYQRIVGVAPAPVPVPAPGFSIDHQPGRVLRVDRGVCTVLTRSGAVRASLAGVALARAAADPSALPCVGDWLVVRSWPDRRLTAEAVLPRRTAVIRHTAGKDASGQVLAANMDVAAVVEPMDGTPDLARVERLLALAWESGARPLVVLTKADLAPDPEAVAASIADVAPGVEVVAASAWRGTGLDRLRPLVAPGHTLGLLGPSGSGKSTLVNALAGASVMATRQTRRADGKGRHTTTYRALVPIPGGGAVLDTPGIRAIGLLDTASGVDRTFSDIARLAEDCRFADCGHAGEPGCAVALAIQSGDLPPRRLASWRKLRKEIEYEMYRRAARQAAQDNSARRAARDRAARQAARGPHRQAGPAGPCRTPPARS